MSHFNDHRYNESGRGENVPPLNSAHSSASFSTASNRTSRNVNAEHEKNYHSLRSSSIRSIVLSPGVISKLTNQNEYLKNLWLTEQENSKALRERVHHLEKKLAHTALLEATANRILQKCFLAAESIAKQNDMFQTVAVELTTVLQVKHVALFFIDSTTNKLWSAGDYNYDINNSVLGQVYLKNKIVHIENNHITNNSMENKLEDSLKLSSDNYGNFEDSSTENILKRGMKTKNLLGYPIRHPLTNKIVAIVEVINKISGNFLKDDILTLKTISEKIALTLSHSQYYYALQKKLQKVQELELKKRETLVKNNQISTQKSIRAIQFAQYLTTWDHYSPTVQKHVIETLKGIFKSPIVFFHIVLSNNNIDEDKEEINNDLKSLYDEIGINMKQGIHDKKIVKITDFGLVSSIISEDNENDHSKRIVGIIAIKRISQHALRFNSQDISLFEQIVRCLTLSRKRWINQNIEKLKREKMGKELDYNNGIIKDLKKTISHSTQHNKLYQLLISSSIAKQDTSGLGMLGRRLHAHILHHIQSFIENISSLQIFLMERVDFDKKQFVKQLFKSITFDEEGESSVNDDNVDIVPLDVFDFSENCGIVSYVANHCKLANVNRPSNDFRCNTTYDNSNDKIMCIPLFFEMVPNVQSNTSDEDDSLISKNEKNKLYGVIKLNRDKSFPSFSVQNEKDITSYASQLVYVLNHFQLKKRILSLQKSLRQRGNENGEDDYKRAEDLGSKLLMEQRFSKAMIHDLTSIHNETELFHVFTMICDRLFRDITSAAFIVDGKNGNLWQPLGKVQKKRHVAGIGVVGYVIETSQTLNLSNAKQSDIYDEGIDGFIAGDDPCPMLCKPLLYQSSSTKVAASGCILLRRTISGRNFLPAEDKLLERLMHHLSLCWEHILLLNTEKLRVEIMANDLKNASAKNVSSMNYSNELSECSTMDSLCSFLRYKINNFCTADKVTFFKYEKEYLQGPNNLKIRLDKKSLVTHAFREKEIIRLNRNVEDHKHFSYEIDRYDDVSGPNSLLYIPVEHLNKRLPYGILCLYKQRFGATFSSIDEQIVHGFALQICSKITLLEGPLSSLADCKEKITELQNNLSKKEAHMSKLRTSDRALRSLGVISKTLNEENMYTCTKNEVQKLIGNCFADLLLISTDPIFVSYKGNDGSFHNKVELTGILLDTYKEGSDRLITDSDIAKTLEYELPDGISRNNQIASMLLVPLVSSRGRILGIIRVGGKRGGHTLTAGDRNTLLRIASVIASKIEIMNFSEEYNELKLNAVNGKSLQEDIIMLQNAIQGYNNIIKSNNFGELYEFTSTAMCSLFQSSRCNTKIFLVKDEDTVWNVDPSTMKERQINRMSDSMSRVMVSKKPIFTSIQDGIIVAPIIVKDVMIALLQIRGTAKSTEGSETDDSKSSRKKQQKRYSQALMKIINHFTSILGTTMNYINQSNEDKRKEEEISAALANLRTTYVNETKAARATQEVLKEALRLCLPIPFNRLSAILCNMICKITGAKTIRFYVCKMEKQNIIEYTAVDRSCKPGEGLVGKAIQTGKQVDSSESSSMHFSSFSKCDMPAPTPSLSDIFCLRCFPIMSSMTELKELFPSLKYPVCIGVMQFFTNTDAPLSKDDEKFIQFIIPELENIIVVRLEREMRMLKLKSITDDRDNKVSKIKEIIHEHEIAVEKLKNQSEDVLSEFKNESDLAIKELHHVNEVALELFEKEQHRLKIKIELQSFLWKVVEATKLRTTHISVHMIFQRMFHHVISCSCAFILIRQKEERKYTFYPVRGSDSGEPCYVSPPVKLIDILQNHEETIHIFGEVEADGYNIVELEQAIGSQYVGSIKYVLAMKLNPEGDVNFMENHEGIVLFVQEADEKLTREKRNTEEEEENDIDEKEGDSRRFTELDIEHAKHFSEALEAAFNFNYFMAVQAGVITQLNVDLNECRAERDSLTKKIDKSYNLQTNLLSNVTRLKAALLKSTEIFFKQINVEGLRRCVQSFCEKFFHSSSIDMWWIKDAIDSNNRKNQSSSKKKKKKLADEEEDVEIPMEQPTLYQHIFSTEQPLCIDDVSDDSRFSTSNDYIQQRKTVTFLGMPLFRPSTKRDGQKAKVFGVIALFKNKQAVHESQGTGFSLDDIDILKHVSDIVSLVLLRILMYKTVLKLDRSLTDNIVAHEKLLNANNNNEVKTNSLLINIKDTKRNVEKLNECMSLCLLIIGSKAVSNIRDRLLSIHKFLPVDEMVLFSIDPANDRFLEEIICSVDGRARDKIPFGVGCIGSSVKKGLIINIKNTASDRRYQNKYDRAISCAARNVLAVPFKDSRGNPSGVLYLINKRNVEYGSDEDKYDDSNGFTDTDEILASNLAACISAALIHMKRVKKMTDAISVGKVTNKRMKENLEKTMAGNMNEVKKSRKNTSLLVGATCALMSSIDVPHKKLSQQACQILSCEKVYIFVFDQIKKQLVSYNYVQDELHPHRIGLGQGIPGIVLSDGQPIITNAPQTHKNFNNFLDVRSSCQTNNLICVPCVNMEDGKTVGVIYGINHTAEFKTSDIESLQPLASITATAIAMYQRKSMFGNKPGNGKESSTAAAEVQTDPDKKVQSLHDQLAKSRKHHKKQLEKVYKTTEQLIKIEKNKCNVLLEKMKKEKEALVRNHQEAQHRRVVASTNLMEEFT